MKERSRDNANLFFPFGGFGGRGAERIGHPFAPVAHELYGTAVLRYCVLQIVGQLANYHTLPVCVVGTSNDCSLYEPPSPHSEREDSQDT